jgi:hypothetical protein
MMPIRTRRGHVIRSMLCGLFIAAVLLTSTACREERAIGEIVGDAPVTAVIYETGTDQGEPFSGIVYRKVLDHEKLLATEETPVLVVFLDDGIYSGQAISFVETVADTYRDRLRVVRVNVLFSDNPREVTELVRLFGITGYPCFAIAEDGTRRGSITGYERSSESEILAMIERTIAEAQP